MEFIKTLYENPEITFFLALLGLVNVFFIYLLARSFIGSSNKETTANSSILDKIVDLLGKYHEESTKTRIAIENNTLALIAVSNTSKELLDAGVKINTKLDDAIAKILNGILQLSNSINELGQNRTVEHQGLAETLKCITIRLDELSEELLNGNSADKNSDPPGPVS